jgi:glutamyl-tRNA reductase
VASGLDSAVLGEHEIQGQVKAAWERAHADKVTGTALNGVFQHALEVGKRARTETAIARNVTSLSQAAVAMAIERLGTLAGKHILVLGAGEMGERMVARLADADVELVVANRTWEKALSLADVVDGRAARLTDLADELALADVVLTSTGATEMLVEFADLTQAMRDRAHRPMLLVDIAVPRDIDPAAATIPGVTLLDMDDLRLFAQAGIAEREKEVAEVNAIIDAELDQYVVRSSAREVAPLIAVFRQQADLIRDAELAALAGRLAEMDHRDRELVEKVVNRVIGKLLHQPTTRLKDAAGTARGERLAEALRDLFEIHE